MLEQSPPAVTITFGEEPDPNLSRIQLLDQSGAVRVAPPVQQVAGQPAALTIPLPKLGDGVYTVSWRTISRVDGHSAAGTFAFGIGVSPQQVAASGGAGPGGAAGGSSGSGDPSPLGVAGRALLYAGLMLLAGLALVGLVVMAAWRPGARLLAGAWLVAAAGSVLVVAGQAADAGLGPSRLWGSSIGGSATFRAAALLATALAVAAAARLRGTPRRRALGAVAAAAAAAMLVDVLQGHAAASAPEAVNVGLQWIHIAAAGVWIGGLAALLVAIRGEPSDAKGVAVRRFSALAFVALIAVLATGVIRAAIQIGAWGRVLTTAFGIIVVVKLALITALAALGAVNRYRNVPGWPRLLRGLRRMGSAELGVATVAVIAAALLVNVAPPAAAQASPPVTGQPPLVVTASDYATTVRVALTVSPGTAGFDSFAARVTDYDTGKDAGATGVELRFSLPSQPSLGESTLRLQRQSDGSFAAPGSNLSIEGTWTVTALVVGGGRSVEVPMTVTPRSVPPQVDVNRSPGAPTLYTIHLAGGGAVQVYRDPEQPGPQRFHATFFDARGSGLPVTSPAITEAPPGGSPAPLSLTELDPGHFVAGVDLRGGRYRFDITATDPSGKLLSTHIELDVGS